jgi:hypothetical protein
MKEKKLQLLIVAFNPYIIVFYVFPSSHYLAINYLRRLKKVRDISKAMQDP